MSEQEVICIICPVGCKIKVINNQGNLEFFNNQCKRGAHYAKQEVLEPRRTLTSTIAVIGGSVKRCPIISSQPVLKQEMMEMMKIIRQTTIEAPIEVGDVCIANICDSKIDMIATRNIQKK